MDAVPIPRSRPRLESIVRSIPGSGCRRFIVGCVEGFLSLAKQGIDHRPPLPPVN